jgi:hypothetical protein
VNCPSCDQPLPEGAGQHAVFPSADVVDCPSCGARVDLASGKAFEGVSAEGRAEEQGVAPISAGEPESFAGEETVEGVMAEIEEKEQT